MKSQSSSVVLVRTAAGSVCSSLCRCGGLLGSSCDGGSSSIIGRVAQAFLVGSLRRQVSCPYRIGTVHTIRVAAKAAASMHRGAMQIVCYGCMSVCELNNCKKPRMGFELAYATRSTVWLSHAGRARAGVLGQTSKVTWLILPVVICLSQRLSHACLSISLYTVKLRMAH
jgi:hypothetical protein